jgi:hypothetical protein
MMRQAKPVERRRHRRLSVTGNPLAVMRPAPESPGKLLCISDEAAEILYGQGNCKPAAETEEIDILVPGFTRAFYLQKVSVETVSDQAVGPSARSGSPPMRKRVVTFRRLTPDQSAQLRSLIYEYAR